MKKRIPHVPDAPLVDPKGMDFRTFYEAHIWGPPDANGTMHCINQEFVREHLSYRIWATHNEYFGRESEYYNWERILEAGRNYLVGSEVPMKKFVARHTSSLTGWQRLAFFSGCLTRTPAARSIGVTRNGKTKILINVD